MLDTPSSLPSPPLLRGIFHVHTNISRDCLLAPEALVHRCLDQGIDVLAVTDHEEIVGAQEVQRKAPFQVIVGEEVRAAEGGDIIGLFLEKKIEQGQPADSILEDIRAQGGLVYLPHPFEARGGRYWPDTLRGRLLAGADIIETWNAHSRNTLGAERAASRARALGKVTCVGADAHWASEIGPAVVFLPPFETPAQLLASLGAAYFTRGRGPFWARAASGVVQRWRRS